MQNRIRMQQELEVALQAMFVQIVNELQPVSEIFLRNLSRINSIGAGVRIVLDSSDSDQSNFVSETLRANVVFLHSAMETYLTETLRVLYQKQFSMTDILLSLTPEYLGRPTKKLVLSIEDIVPARFAEITELIKESVENRLNKMSFNSATDVVSKLGEAGLNLPIEFKSNSLPSIEGMIKRRHQIVHESDLVQLESGQAVVREISIQEYTNWAQHVGDLRLEVFFAGIACLFTPERVMSYLLDEYSGQLVMSSEHYETSGYSEFLDSEIPEFLQRARTGFDLGLRIQQA